MPPSSELPCERLRHSADNPVVPEQSCKFQKATFVQGVPRNLWQLRADSEASPPTTLRAGEGLNPLAQHLDQRLREDGPGAPFERIHYHRQLPLWRVLRSWKLA